ncbi:exonuclease SbcC [Nocardioides seonyuensis]|uniref:Exonuclease SbcC n=1 Tax=Nocardioides seonyuensis TaxID=2518371 RepID=A0A4P7IIF9_9ACTN|nr:exonuclease SbcC [Nocardioides seonyuensis]QBX57125.1 exonuclease SbcC [Nocardioides seonyuensis]
MAVEPSDYFELSMGELREVARFAVQGAQEVLGTFESVCPGDRRPRAAVEAAWEFANGAARSNLQRARAVDAHRAARNAPTEAAKHAANAAGDAASAAYLHPFAKADQLRHILGADAHAAYSEELRTGDPALAAHRIACAVSRATPRLVEVLRRYPRAPAGSRRVGILMKSLDDELRTDEALPRRGTPGAV